MQGYFTKQEQTSFSLYLLMQIGEEMQILENQLEDIFSNQFKNLNHIEPKNKKKTPWFCHLQNPNLEYSWKFQKKENWLLDLLVELGMNNATSVPMHYNNGSCIKIAKDLVYHSKTKPFAIHFKYI